MIKRLLFLYILIFSVFILQASPKYEVRAVWLTTNWGLDWPSRVARNKVEVEKQKKELCGMLDFIHSMNFNMVFFQVRLRGEVIYPSSIEPCASVITGEAGGLLPYDPVDFAVKACHERGLEFHAWMVCIPVGTAKQVRLLKGASVASVYPDLCKRMGNNYFLDPGNPQTAVYLSSIAKEIVTKYDVDGIHLDYIRYPENASKFPDKDSYHKWADEGQSLIKWRTENINRIVSSVYDTVKAISPAVRVSSSPLGRARSLPGFPANGWNCEYVYQDPQCWLREGKQDFIVPMMYSADHNFYPFLYDWAANCYKGGIIPGLGTYRLDKREGNWPLSQIDNQIRFSRMAGTKGQAHFRLKHIMQNIKQIQSLLKYDLYDMPALVPPMGILPSASDVFPFYLNAIESAGGIELEWERVKSARKYVVYASCNDSVDIRKPENIVAIRNSHETFLYIPSLIYRSFAVTAINNYNQESAPEYYYLAGLNKGIEKVLLIYDKTQN